MQHFFAQKEKDASPLKVKHQPIRIYTRFIAVKRHIDHTQFCASKQDPAMMPGPAINHSIYFMYPFLSKE